MPMTRDHRTGALPSILVQRNGATMFLVVLTSFVTHREAAVRRFTSRRFLTLLVLGPV